MDREFYFFCCHVLFTLLEPLHLPEQTEQRQADPSLCSGNANNCPKRSSTEWRPEFESKYARKQYRLVRIATAQWVFTAKYTAPLSKKIPLENHPFSASMDDTGTGARMSPSRHKPRPAWRCGSRRIFFGRFGANRGMAARRNMPDTNMCYGDVRGRAAHWVPCTAPTAYGGGKK
jgi:hypothetical protein